jgi:hypothetical protein
MNPPSLRNARPLVVLWFVIVSANQAHAEQPLHERIDAAIESRLDGAPAGPASDAEFLRRAWLDLAGRIPPADESREFLADPADDKRQRLIDRLLDSPQHVRRMATFLDIMLMQRREDKHVPSAEWERYLFEAVSENKPYDALVTEILSADSADEQTRAAARFYLDREVAPDLLTRDIGRLLLGRDMQCAQCHDHPLVDGYKQDHYYGLFAFVSRSYLFTDRKQKKSFVAEKADGDVTFKSVFEPAKGTMNTRPHIIDAALLQEPTFAKGQEYYVAPGKDVMPVPKYSRRQQLAAAITASPDFSRNMANRLWAMMLGRGLVDPVDMHHADNPPSHPELLELLAEEFRAMKFDMKKMLHEMALSRTYQRTSEIPESMSEADADAARFAVAPLKPLTAEQLAWSLMEASGQVTPLRDAEQARLAGDARLSEILAADAPRQQLGQALVEQQVFEKLNKNATPFVSIYGSAPGENEAGFESSVQQALFVSNGPVLKGWIAKGLAPRLARQEDVKQLADELYLSTLSRLPEEDERLAVAEYLIRQGSSRAAAIEEMAWALLASTEFSFNH